MDSADPRARVRARSLDEHKGTGGGDGVGWGGDGSRWRFRQPRIIKGGSASPAPPRPSGERGGADPPLRSPPAVTAETSTVNSRVYGRLMSP